MAKGSKNPIPYSSKAKPGKTAKQYGTGLVKNKNAGDDTGDKLFKSGKKGNRNQS